MQVNYGEDTIQITWQEIVHANEDAQANEKPGQEEVKEIPGETIQVDFSDRVRTKNQLKQMLGEHEVGKAGDRVITWKSISQERLDSKTLKAEHPALFKKYATQTSYRRFTVKSVA